MKIKNNTVKHLDQNYLQPSDTKETVKLIRKERHIAKKGQKARIIAYFSSKAIPAITQY